MYAVISRHVDPEDSKNELNEYVTFRGKTQALRLAGILLKSDMLISVELSVEDEDLAHLGCQNFPNCDTEGCGPDEDVGHRD